MNAWTAFRAGTMADLGPLLAFVDDACAPAGEDATFAVRLAVEEVFTNILAHGYRGDGPVDVVIHANTAQVRVIFHDDAPAFDLAHAPAPDLVSDAMDRDPGGLGWHLVRQVMDAVDHAARGPRGNTYTLVKRLPVAAPQESD